MIKKVHIIFFLLILLVFFFAECKKMKENKLLGTWETIAFSASDTMTGPPTWTFLEDNRMIYYRKWYNTNTNPATLYEYWDTAFYFFEEEFNKFVISIHDAAIEVDGNYDVKKLSSKLMILEQKNPYLRKEFSKK